jgi:fatty acid desaturase
MRWQVGVRYDRMDSALVSKPSSSFAPGDQYNGQLPVYVDPSVIKRLSRLHSGISSLHIALEWAWIIAAACLCWRYWHPALYVLTVAFIGARQHALIVLTHEAAHYRLFRNRVLNDWVGELFTAWPFVVVSMQAYRRNHLPHHRHINTELDPDWMRKQTPDWVFPTSRGQLFKALLLDAVGIGFLKFVLVALRFPGGSKDAHAPRARAFALGRLAFLVSAATAITWLHGWTQFLLFWVVPHVTWMQLCFHVRSIAEHFAITDKSGLAQTRTVIPNWFDRVFVLPKNANYHLEHHMYPSVPFYRLTELHRLLLEQPGFRESAHFTRGYFGVLRECIKQ